ncbi:OspD family protein [Candidatus Borreliella tachyglossi]|uniref:OspD family protein n=1 Tax=Candidatus Borreliella tachyglossi TaxID=1964448 RepID=UPI004041A909
MSSLLALVISCDQDSQTTLPTSKKEILSNLTQSLQQLENTLKTARSTTDNVNAAMENEMGAVFVSSADLILYAVTHLKTASENTHALAKMSGIDLQELKNAKDIAAVAATAASVVSDTVKKEKQNIDKAFKAQNDLSDQTSEDPTEESDGPDDSDDIKQAKEATKKAWEFALKAQQHIKDAELAAIVALDKIKAELAHNVALADIKEVAELTAKIAKNAMEVATEVMTALNT